MDELTAKALKNFIHSTPMDVYTQLRGMNFLGYSPARGWVYLRIKHPFSFKDIKQCMDGAPSEVFEESDIRVFIAHSAVSTLYKKKVIVKIGQDLSAAEYKIQKALGINSWMKIRKLRPGVSFEQVQKISDGVSNVQQK